jgi:flavin-dependent dehydrogenase
MLMSMASQVSSFQLTATSVDESGWAWCIPLHNGTTSIGLVMNQDAAVARRKASGKGDTTQSASDFYHSSLAMAPNLLKFLSKATVVSDVKLASDFSYSSSSYATPYTRTVGDAGCFIDPFFSSGVHLALTGGLSAAATICASIRGNCSEETAASWHSSKITEAYSRFLVAVLGAYRQMRSQDEHILSSIREDNFDRAFDHLRPSMIPHKCCKQSLTHVQLFKEQSMSAPSFLFPNSQKP